MQQQQSERDMRAAAQPADTSPSGDDASTDGEGPDSPGFASSRDVAASLRLQALAVRSPSGVRLPAIVDEPEAEDLAEGLERLALARERPTPVPAAQAAASPKHVADEELVGAATEADAASEADADASSEVRCQRQAQNVAAYNSFPVHAA